MTQRYILFLIFLGCVFALAGAWIAQTFFGIQPCTLCLYQRYIYWAILVVAAVAALFKYPGMHRFALGVTCLLLLAELGVALYQVAVELHWTPLPAVCKAPSLSGQTIDELRQQLTSQPHVACDQVQWKLFGISMAGYNSLHSMALLLIAIFGLAFARKQKQ
ncbi:MAG: disulfide bond formation protein B [Pseudomonadota bacterium]